METCDSCGVAVAAKVVVALPSGRTLTYCQHHATVYAPGLDRLGAFVYQLGEGSGDVA